MPATAEPDAPDVCCEHKISDKLIELESSVFAMNGMVRVVAFFLISLAALLASRSMPAESARRVGSRYQEAPQPVDSREAIDSAFARSIARDSAQYELYRSTLKIAPEIDDGPTPANDEDLFPGLTAYRESYGV